MCTDILKPLHLVSMASMLHAWSAPLQVAPEATARHAQGAQPHEVHCKLASPDTDDDMHLGVCSDSRSASSSRCMVQMVQIVQIVEEHLLPKGLLCVAQHS